MVAMLILEAGSKYVCRGHHCQVSLNHIVGQGQVLERSILAITEAKELCQLHILDVGGKVVIMDLAPCTLVDGVHSVVSDTMELVHVCVVDGVAEGPNATRQDELGNDWEHNFGGHRMNVERMNVE